MIAQQIRMLVVITALSIPLGGCWLSQIGTDISTGYSIATGSSVSVQTANVAVNSFDVLKSTGTSYILLQKCGTPHAPVVCADPKVLDQLIPDLRNGTAARDKLWAEANAANSTGASISNYNALQLIIDQLQKIYDTYSIGKKGA